MAAYSGSDAAGVSTGILEAYSNWAVKYNGLMRYDLFKRNFKRFSLQHNYRASIPLISTVLILINNTRRC
jgi:cell surface protein SprA